MSFTVRAKLNPASKEKFLKALNDYAKDSREGMHDIFVKNAALLLETCAVLTPPMVKAGGKGLSAGAQKAGEQAISGDLRKIFVAGDDKSSGSASALLTQQLAYATKTNNMGLFNKVIIGGKLGTLKKLSPIMRKIANDLNYDRAFKKAKNYFGKTFPVLSDYGPGFVKDIEPIHNRILKRFGGRLKQGVKPGVTKYLVENLKTVEDYAKKRAYEVGKVKAGYGSAIRSLPACKSPSMKRRWGAKLLDASWIMRHASGQGYAMMNDNSSNITLLVGNLIGNINDIAQTKEGEVLSLAMAIRINNIKADIVQQQARNAKKFNNK